MKKGICHQYIALILVATFSSGCVAVMKNNYKNEPRVEASFESLAAAQVFYDALLDKTLPKDGDHGSIHIGETLYWTITYESGNVVFNRAVTLADLNHDHIISEQEAKQYAATKAR